MLQFSNSLVKAHLVDDRDHLPIIQASVLTFEHDARFRLRQHKPGPAGLEA
jgi:hypothetical protein